MKDDVKSNPASLPDIIGGKPRALRVSEVARLLAVSEREIYKLAAERRIPFFRIGGSVRFDPAALAAWLRARMVPASPNDPARDGKSSA